MTKRVIVIASSPFSQRDGEVGLNSDHQSAVQIISSMLILVQHFATEPLIRTSVKFELLSVNQSSEFSWCNQTRVTRRSANNLQLTGHHFISVTKSGETGVFATADENSK
jgi:hypothetical protein